MKFEKKAASAAGVVAMILIAIAPAAFAKGKPQSPPNQYTTACGLGTVLVAPETLWPPNHKLKTITISYVEPTADMEAISLTINSITDSEIGQDCGPNEADWEFDSTPVTNTDPATVATTVQLRAERCGDDKAEGGRTYTIDLTCGSSDGTTTDIQVPVVVPHNHPKHVK